MLLKKTRIALGRRNFAALMLAIEVLRKFDVHACPVHATIKKNGSSAYTVKIGYEVERANEFSCSTLSFQEVIIIFQLSTNRPHKPEGPIQLLPSNGVGGFKFSRPEGLIFFYEKETIVTPPETEKVIFEFYTRIRRNIPWDSDYPVKRF